MKQSSAILFKKITIITLLALYSLTSFGVSVNLMYCCGKLKKVSLEVAGHHDNCTHKQSKDCCKDKTLQIKVSDDQRSQVPDLGYLYGSQQAITPPAFFTLTAVPGPMERSSATAASPPLPLNRSVLYSVFRI